VTRQLPRQRPSHSRTVAASSDDRGNHDLAGTSAGSQIAVAEPIAGVAISNFVSRSIKSRATRGAADRPGRFLQKFVETRARLLTIPKYYKYLSRETSH
jgi:hypothetical protein